MPRKPEQFSEASSLYLVLSAAAQYIQTIAGTLDTCSPLAKAEIYKRTAQLIGAVTEAQVESLELKRWKETVIRSENGKK